FGGARLFLALHSRAGPRMDRRGGLWQERHARAVADRAEATLSARRANRAGVHRPSAAGAATGSTGPRAGGLAEGHVWRRIAGLRRSPARNAHVDTQLFDVRRAYHLCPDRQTRLRRTGNGSLRHAARRTIAHRSQQRQADHTKALLGSLSRVAAAPDL